MSKYLGYILLFFCGLLSYSQPMTVSTSAYTVPQLVSNVLFDSGGANKCIGNITNVTWSTGTNYGSTNGIGYFQNTNPNFPFSSGVVLCTGDVTKTPGPNNLSTLNYGNTAWLGDSELRTYMLNKGEIQGTDSYENATIIEFDFIPLGNNFSFNFLFTSEEYPTYQCNYSDAFAFFLKDVTAGTPTVNLALIPNTNTPISVTTVHNSYNPKCTALNESYFDKLNIGNQAATSATSYDGQTKIMTASSVVIPNNVYHLKLVIADLNDYRYDSAVFIGAGSFNSATIELEGSGEFAGVTDFSAANGNEVCFSKSVLIQAGKTFIPSVVYTWKKDGLLISGANTNEYTVTQPGNYEITMEYPGGCLLSDSIKVDFRQEMQIGVPNDISQCESSFDLTSNELDILNGTPNPVLYFHSLSDAKQEINPILNASNYTGTDGEIIYVLVIDVLTGCTAITQFKLNVGENYCVITPLKPSDLKQCESTYLSGESIFDLTRQTLLVLGTEYNSLQYNVTYYTNFASANSGMGAISNPESYVGVNNQTIYVRVALKSNLSKYGITEFNLVVDSIPEVLSPVAPLSFCADEIPQKVLMDLTIKEKEIKGTIDTSDVINYYNTITDAQDNTNVIQNPSEFEVSENGTVYVRVENEQGCYNISNFEVVHNKTPKPVISTLYNNNTICVDYETKRVEKQLNLFSGIKGSQDYTFEWFEEGSSTPILEANGSWYVVKKNFDGVFSKKFIVEVTDKYGCIGRSEPFEVLQSGKASIQEGTMGYEVKAFSEDSSITVLVEGFGSYQYSIDDGPRQISNIFKDVAFGVHTIHVWDSKDISGYNCDDLVIENVLLVNYPRYFTPNGDGINDKWNIVGWNEKNNAKIYIFDRYGKLLKEIDPNEDGWDGTFNGKGLPSDDYWFVVEFLEQGISKQFKSHFSLKR